MTLTITILLTLILTALLIFLISALRKTKATEEINIPLSELSTIWLKPNKNKEMQIEQVEESIPLTAPQSQPFSSSIPQQIPLQQAQKPVTELTETGAFWTECIEPHKDIFQTQNCLSEVKEIISFLEKHGHNPSVTLDNNDRESVDLISVRDNLAKVTLKEHTYTTGRIIIDLVKQQYKDYETIIPSALIAALTHDIGKVPELRLSGVYNSYEHPQVSIGKLTEIFAGKDVTWLKDVYQAVRDHHVYSSHTLTVLLKKADRQARQMELAMFTKEYKISTFNEWFNPNAFINILEPHINVTQTNRWQGFSFHGIAYFRPDFLYEKAKELAGDMKILDIDIIYSSEKENVLKKVTESLKKIGAVADILLPEQYARKFEVQIYMGKRQSWFLTPLRLDAFPDIQKIEARKAGQLRIDAVRLI